MQDISADVLTGALCQKLCHAGRRMHNTHADVLTGTECHADTLRGT